MNKNLLVTLLFLLAAGTAFAQHKFRFNNDGKFKIVQFTVLTAHGNIPDGVQAIKNGAFDYITKGDDNRKIIPTISRAIEESEKKKGKIGRASCRERV